MLYTTETALSFVSNTAKNNTDAAFDISIKNACAMGQIDILITVLVKLNIAFDICNIIIVVESDVTYIERDI